MNTTSLRRIAASVSLLALVAGAAPALAQTTQPDPETPAEDDNVVTDVLPQSEADASLPDEAVAEDEVVVTGTRIRTTQYDFANPVVSIDSSAIQNAGTTNLTTFLTDTPALVGSFDAVDASGSNAGIGFSTTAFSRRSTRFATPRPARSPAVRTCPARQSATAISRSITSVAASSLEIFRSYPLRLVRTAAACPSTCSARPRLPARSTSS